MDDTSLTPFVNALRRVFDIAFQMNVVTTQGAGEPGAAISPDVSAGITLGGALQATLLLEFSLPTAQRLVSLFAGLDVHEQAESDIRDAIGEIACIVVHPDYQREGRADTLLRQAEERARSEGLTRVMALTTHTPHWFIERGFAQADVESLPVEKRALYNLQRNSKVFVKTL